MKEKKEGISRRRFISTSLGVTAGVVLAGSIPGQGKEAPATPAGKGTRLILLGTAGGPRPNKLRAQTANVVIVDKVAYIVDCGIGVSRQMASANVPLVSIRHIFLTHHHSDHNLEYGPLIYNIWTSGFKGRIDTWGPPEIKDITRLFFETNRYDIDLRITDEGRQPIIPMVNVNEIWKDGLVMQDERVKVTAALVNHPPVYPAYAYRFDTPGRSIVFSGDTTPNDNLISLAQGADVLVHEVIDKDALGRLMARVGYPNATKLVQHIVACHTTKEDVGIVAKKAGVKTLVLNHIVPADDTSIKDDTWIAAVKANFSGKVIVGKDLMEI